MTGRLRQRVGGPWWPSATRRAAVRRGAWLAAALATAPIGAACAPGGGPGQPAGGGKPAGRVAYMDWRLRAGNPIDEAFFKEVREGFLAKYPEVRWEQLQVDWGKTYLEKLISSAAADDLPDAVFSSIIWARDLWEQGLLEDLGPYIARTPSVAPNQYVEPALFYNSWKGKTFGIPHVGPDFRVIYVNRKLFAEAGIDASDEALARWTWADMTTNHQKLVRREGERVTRGGVWFSGGTNLEDFTTFLYANGGQFYNKDRNGVAFNNTQGQQVMDGFVDFRSKFRMHEGPQGLSALEAFPQGAAAAVVMGSWNQRDVLGNPLSANLEYTMMNIPRGPSGKQQATTTWTNMTVLPKGSKNKDSAWAFIEYYSSLPLALRQFEIWKQGSPRKDFLDSREWKEASTRIPSYVPWRRIAESGGPYAYIKNAEMGEQLQPLFTDVVVNATRAPRDALAEAERQANLILSQVR
ncbi:MAG TPA: extracellular solute-binding protein [Chloroflexota bacterium]|nr:extracellular solute-binding protein [Chloroflexota bacterium]